jgi:hypothetical protein
MPVRTARYSCAGGMVRSSPTGHAAKREKMGKLKHESCQIVGIRWQLVFDDVPTQTIARDDVLVKVKSTAVNHLYLVKASGILRQILPINLSWIPGHEFSGFVEQIGSDITTYLVTEKVGRREVPAAVEHGSDGDGKLPYDLGPQQVALDPDFSHRFESGARVVS